MSGPAASAISLRGRIRQRPGQQNPPSPPRHGGGPTGPAGAKWCYVDGGIEERVRHTLRNLQGGAGIFHDSPQARHEVCEKEGSSSQRGIRRGLAGKFVEYVTAEFWIMPMRRSRLRTRPRPLTLRPIRTEFKSPAAVVSTENKRERSRPKAEWVGRLPLAECSRIIEERHSSGQRPSRDRYFECFTTPVEPSGEEGTGGTAVASNSVIRDDQGKQQRQRMGAGFGTTIRDQGSDGVQEKFEGSSREAELFFRSAWFPRKTRKGN